LVIGNYADKLIYTIFLMNIIVDTMAVLILQ
jgi:hypothetical protein